MYDDENWYATPPFPSPHPIPPSYPLTP
jgi:hypothetical protein